MDLPKLASDDRPVSFRTKRDRGSLISADLTDLCTLTFYRAHLEGWWQPIVGRVTVRRSRSEGVQSGKKSSQTGRS